MDEELIAIVKGGMAATGMSQERVEHLVSQMITYVDSHVQETEGITAETFFNWLQEQDSKVLN